MNMYKIATVMMLVVLSLQANGIEKFAKNIYIDALNVKAHA